MAKGMRHVSCVGVVNGIIHCPPFSLQAIIALLFGPSSLPFWWYCIISFCGFISLSTAGSLLPSNNGFDRIHINLSPTFNGLHRTHNYLPPSNNVEKGRRPSPNLDDTFMEVPLMTDSTILDRTTHAVHIYRLHCTRVRYQRGAVRKGRHPTVLEFLCSRSLSLERTLTFHSTFQNTVYERSKVVDLVDPKLIADGIVESDELRTCQVAFLCLQPRPSAQGHPCQR